MKAMCQLCEQVRAVAQAHKEFQMMQRVHKGVSGISMILLLPLVLADDIP